MAKIAFIVILLYIISWAPYSCVALTAFAGYADMLTPYMNSVPAVIAKASAIHNPIIYAITHPKYRSAIGRYIPFLRMLLCITTKDRPTSSSFQSTRRSTLTSQSSDCNRLAKPRLSSQSDSKSPDFSDMDMEYSSRTPVTNHLFSDVKQACHACQRSKARGHTTGELERAAIYKPTDPSICRRSQIITLTMPEDIAMADINLQPASHLPATVKVATTSLALDSITEDSGATCNAASSIIVTSISTPYIMNRPPSFHGNLNITKTSSPVAKEPPAIARPETPCHK
ncbi:hypothetical protein LDENG_00021750 [Lucifuga dentata]|nr:hypothetical protein LDENG_00021750 [Lucifuga dentata]